MMVFFPWCVDRLALTFAKVVFLWETFKYSFGIISMEGVDGK